MSHAPRAGDRVHVPGLGTGTLRELRGPRCVVDIKGLPVVVAIDRVEAAAPARPRRSATARAPAAEPAGTDGDGAPPVLDLHGRTVAEAVDELDAFVNDAILAGHATLYVIHGRSGGRVKAAVHERLRAIPSIRAFRVDPRNAGQTVVRL